ncbi:hypothetical protein [Fluviibacter phosphoraccumulans]|uniref:Uncharacterized protein n=1 Tax=Fluviibacter phosphoraccumulans TaxID=1751046 RepID=A0A7R6R807_9RHOO|nr:hypothetical protein [Fluviibacter phosphoraccumulans]BBU69664.1 hypothetical protein ICHIAU1_19470 [Fluviibacter phosphoraccumulans]BBU71152.1 hypothetical protein ICHIJ1_10710 [Fluviibacter phosphoraccumulans]
MKYIMEVENLKKTKSDEIIEFNTYSKLSAEIYSNLKDPASKSEDFQRLIKLSYCHVKKNKIKSIKILHDKYAESGRLKYGDCVLRGILDSDELIKLKFEFEKDPSDMGLVIKLAVAYALDGYKQRAKQLLERVCSSGYPERSQAKKMIEQINTGNLLG